VVRFVAAVLLWFVLLSVAACEDDDDLADEASSASRTLMFCVPFTRDDGATVATTNGTGRYRPNSCEPELDESGDPVVDGGTPTWAAPPGPFPEQLIWMPATGATESGPKILVTGAVLENAETRQGPGDEYAVIANIRRESQPLFASMTEQAINQPLAIYVDGEPLRGADGNIIAPIVLSRIEDTLLISGLAESDAAELTDEINSRAFR
jgi:hypothetical protein